MYASFKNAELKINGSGILATDLKMSIGASLAPLFYTQDKSSKFLNANNGVGGVVEFNYYLTGNDYLKVFTVNEQSPISGNFGGLYFKSGYLQSYNLNCSPNAPVMANAQIVYYEDWSGLYTKQYIRSTGTKILNYCDATIIDTSNDGLGGNLGLLSGISNIQFSFNSEINPLYLAGDKNPVSINFGKKELVASFITDCYSGELPATGKAAGIKVFFNHPELPSLTESFGVSGVLFKRDLDVSVGDMLKARLYIRQDFIQPVPGITSLSSSTTAPGSTFTVAGNNFKETIAVYIGQKAASFTIDSDAQLTVTVPLDVSSGSVFIRNQGGTTSSQTLFTPTYPALTVDKLQTISGVISGLAYISGSNFYDITDVRFSTTALGLFTGSSGFRVINSTMIAAPIPVDAAWGPILVMATGRGVSGKSVEKFVPIPTIYGFFPTSGMSGDVITISGQGFSGVTGVLFNNLPNIIPFTVSVTSGFNTGMSVIVPTGNVRGPIKILVQSGISVTSIDNFNPFANLTGIIPLSGRTGSAVYLLGNNLFPDIMYSLGNNSFAVTFPGNTTGVFFRTQFVNPRFTGLSGLIPYGAKSGNIAINYSVDASYSSNVLFTLINEPPTIVGITPKSGTYSGYIQITGSNLYDISAVKLSGLGLISTIPNYVGNTLGNAVSIRIPVLSPKLTGDLYTIIVETTIGANVTGNGLLTILDSPILSGFSGVLLGTSGAYGSRILVSGKNIYPNSQIFMPYSGISGESGQAFVDSGSFNSINSQLVFYVPLSARTGLSNIILYNGVDYASGANFKLINKPTISGLEHWSRRSGEWGTGIVISGSFLSNVTSVTFGTGLSANFSFITDTGLNVTVPESADTNYITINSLAGPYTSTGLFVSYMPLVNFSGFTPQSAFTGEQIQMSGSRLNTVDMIYFTGGSSQIGFDYRYFTVIGTSTINMPTPAGITSGQITLRNSRGLVTSTQFFEPALIPNILGFSPAFAAHNEVISISGNNLSGITAVYFQSPVSGRYVLGLNRSNVGLTGISISVPREISIGSIIISGSGRLWSSSQVFVPLCTISGFDPASATSGNTITITGINATNVLTGILFMTGDHKFWNAFSGVSIVNTFNATGNHIIDPTTGYSTYVIPLDAEKIASGRLFLINSYYSGYISGTDSFLTSAISGKVSNILSVNKFSVTETSPII